MKTIDLIGPALDWAVAKALGYMPAKWEKRQWGRELVLAPEREFSNQLLKVPEGYPMLSLARFEPSTDWAQGGPIIERERITVEACPPFGQSRGEWRAAAWSVTCAAYGPTPLVAGMRCYVASKLGDEIEIPPELL